MPSSQGLYYFDRPTERFTYRFQHNESNPDSLDSNAVFSVYQDRGGVPPPDDQPGKIVWAHLEL